MDIFICIQIRLRNIYIALFIFPVIIQHFTRSVVGLRPNITYNACQLSLDIYRNFSLNLHLYFEYVDGRARADVGLYPSCPI